MAHDRTVRALLIVVVTVAILAVLACEESSPTADIDSEAAATVHPTVDNNVLTKSASSPIPTLTPTPEPDLQATVQAMVQTALPTEMPTGTPDVPATIEAGVAATIESVPTGTSTATSTPTPTATQSVPTATPMPTEPHTPTPTPTLVSTPTLAHLVEGIKASLVYILTSDGGSGTGFIVDEEGLVATNAHVVGRFDTVSVLFEDGRQYEGAVLGIDEIADLAIVEIITTRKFKPMELGNSNEVRVGDDVIALGYPLSYELGSSLTVTRGIISSKRIYDGFEEFQTDAAINPGNSGGPLVDREGKVVGVNYAELALSGGTPVDNIGFSIAIDELKGRMPALIRGESALRPTPTPGQWTRYSNDDYGFAMDIAPGWYLDGETDEGDATFLYEDGTGITEIYTYHLGDDWTLQEHAESERDYFEERAQEEMWDVYELKSFQKRQLGTFEYYLMAYRWRLSSEYCTTDVVKLIFLSDFYPSKPYGFAVGSGVCEDSLGLHGEPVETMLSSFVEQELGSAVPTTTPVPWMTYQNDYYGYKLDIAPGMFLEEGTSDHIVSFRSADGKSILNIVATDIGMDSSLDRLAEDWQSILMESAEEDSWKIFEITSLQKRQDGDREDHHLLYRLQQSLENCVSSGIAKITLSDFYPSKPFGFFVESSVCEDSLDLYDDSRIEMIASFIPNWVPE